MKRPSHDHLSTWYRQLGQSLEAGISLVEALRLVSPPRKDWESWPRRLESGESFDTILEGETKHLPLIDIYLLSASMETGRQVSVFSRLSELHERAEEVRKSVLGAILYPVGLLHFAVLSFPMYPIGNAHTLGAFVLYPGDFWPSVGLSFLTLWGLFLVLRPLTFLWKRLARVLPGLRGYQKHASLARFADALEGFLVAGVSMESAWGGAAMCSGDSQLEREALVILPKIRVGQNPGSHLDSMKRLPKDFISLYRTGESTGQLPQNLVRLAERHRGEALRAIKRAAFWYPKLVFLLIAIYAGIAIVRGFSEYLEMFDQFE